MRAAQVAHVEILFRRRIRPALEQALAHQIDEPLKSFAVYRPIAADDALRQIFVNGYPREFKRDPRAFADQLSSLLPIGMGPLHRTDHCFEIAHGQLTVGFGPAAVDDQTMKLQIRNIVRQLCDLRKTKLSRARQIATGIIIADVLQFLRLARRCPVGPFWTIV